MKNPFIRKRRVVKKNKKPGDFLALRKGISLVGGIFLKFFCFVIAMVMISLLFVSLYEYLLKSPYMKLEKVVVSGIEDDLETELLKMSQLDRDTSLLSINLDETKRRLEKHPWIRSVNLEKRFPNTLVIRAEKEEPLAVVATDKLYFMNKWGKVFKEVFASGELDFPIITGISPKDAFNERQLVCAAEVLRILESEDRPLSLADLSEIHVREDGNVHLYFSSLPVIRIKSNLLDKRMDDLKKVVDHLFNTGRMHLVRGINLNYQDGAVVSFKKG